MDLVDCLAHVFNEVHSDLKGAVLMPQTGRLGRCQQHTPAQRLFQITALPNRSIRSERTRHRKAAHMSLARQGLWHQVPDKLGTAWTAARRHTGRGARGVGAVDCDAGLAQRGVQLEDVAVSLVGAVHKNLLDRVAGGWIVCLGVNTDLARLHAQGALCQSSFQQ
jgi:hypothetical protein